MTSSYLDKDHTFCCKNKAGYIFPAIVRTKLFLSEEADEQLYFLTSFKTEPVTRTFIYFITDNTDKILDFSSTSLTYFKYTITAINALAKDINKPGEKITELNKFIAVEKKFKEKNNREEIIVNCKDGVKRKFNVYVETIL